MKKIFFFTMILTVLFTVTGCQQKYVELAKETISQLDASKIIEVDIVSTGATPAEWKNPAKWKGDEYRIFFPIRDCNRISIIIECIKKATAISTYNNIGDKKTPFVKIIFRTEKIVYFMGIMGDQESTYGDWWDSPELHKYFEKWGFFKRSPKIDSNQITRRIEHPPKENDPNFPGVQRFEPNG